jgi:hypothetical protein
VSEVLKKSDGGGQRRVDMTARPIPRTVQDMREEQWRELHIPILLAYHKLTCTLCSETAPSRTKMMAEKRNQ